MKNAKHYIDLHNKTVQDKEDKEHNEAINQLNALEKELDAITDKTVCSLTYKRSLNPKAVKMLASLDFKVFDAGDGISTSWEISWVKPTTRTI